MFEHVNKRKKLSFLSKRGYTILTLLFFVVMVTISFCNEKNNRITEEIVKSSEIQRLTGEISKDVIEMEKNYANYLLSESDMSLNRFNYTKSNYDRDYKELKSKLITTEQNKELLKIDSNMEKWEAIIKKLKGFDFSQVNKKVYLVNEINNSLSEIRNIQKEHSNEYVYRQNNNNKIIVFMYLIGTLSPFIVAIILNKSSEKLADELISIDFDLRKEVEDKKKLSINLSKSLAIHGMILTLSPEAIVLMDKNGVIQDFNPAAEHLFGYKKEQMLGKKFSESFISKEERKKYDYLIDKSSEKENSDAAFDKKITINVINSKERKFPVELQIGIVDLNSSLYFIGFIKNVK